MPFLVDTAAFSPLRYPIFRAVWIASFISSFGALIESVAASWMMTSIASSASMVTLVQAAAMSPLVLFSLLAGAIADNFDRRVLMLIMFPLMLVIAATLSVITWLGLVTPWLLLVFTFLIACGGTFIGPAWQSSVVDMVPRSELPAAVALNSISFNIVRTVGPAIGGLIVAAFGAAVAFAVNAVSYLGVIAVLARWRPPPAERRLTREPIGIAMGAGVRYIAMSPDIRGVLARSAVFGIGAIAIPALLPIIARNQSGDDAFAFGLMLGAFGIGALAAGVSIGRLRARYSAESIVRVALGASSLASLAVALSPIHFVTLGALMVAGAGWVLAFASFTVAVQLSAPRWVEARAISLYNVAAFGGLAAGSGLYGLIADRWSVDSALLTGGAILAVGAVMGLLRPMPQVDGREPGPALRWSEPEITLDIEPRSGPIVVTIEYRIREDDLPEFLELMAERRRGRLRDGARRWSLHRDLGDPELWTERYQSPTWLEYLRHTQRRAEADGGLSERFLALHQGPNPPVVHRTIERQTRSVSPHAVIGQPTDPRRPF